MRRALCASDLQGQAAGSAEHALHGAEGAVLGHGGDAVALPARVHGRRARDELQGAAARRLHRVQQAAGAEEHLSATHHVSAAQVASLFAAVMPYATLSFEPSAGTNASQQCCKLQNLLVWNCCPTRMDVDPINSFIDYFRFRNGIVYFARCTSRSKCFLL